jgi:hypothetical protein
MLQQGAHVDKLLPNPKVGEYTRRQARRVSNRRLDRRQFPIA